MNELKAGTRLRSVVGGAEVIVTRGGEGVVTCAGSPMAPTTAADPSTSIRSDDAGPRLVLGKRYRAVDSGVEVLCVRQGAGALELDGAPMDLLTQPKPLPASD